MNEDHDFDDVLTESLRRRGAVARIGDASLADVQQRVVRRRRRTVAAATAALLVPLAVGAVVLAHDNDAPHVASPADIAGPDTVPVTMTTNSPAMGNGGWRCTGDAQPDAVEGWVVYPYCEPLCPQTTAVAVPTSTIALPPSAIETSTTVPLVVETTVPPVIVTTVPPVVEATATVVYTTVVADPTSTIAAPRC